MKSKKIKKRVFDIIQIGEKEDLPSRIFDIGIAVVILLNILCMFLDTFESLAYIRPILHNVEMVTIVIFCVEYIVRIWTADLLYPQKTAMRARIRFLYSYEGIVDLLTVLPFFFLSGFVVFRMLRVVRILHLFRINSQYDSFRVITTVLYEKRNQLLSSIFIIIVLMLGSSLCMYSAENAVQPELFANAFSGIWWSVSTVLTVGYGDIYPVTVLGKCMAICIAFLGVGAVAIPTGIISAGFVERYTRETALLTEHLDVEEIGEVVITAGSPCCDRCIADIYKELNLKVYLVFRDNMSIIATNDLIVRENDLMIVQAVNIKK